MMNEEEEYVGDSSFQLMRSFIFLSANPVDNPFLNMDWSSKVNINEGGKVKPPTVLNSTYTTLGKIQFTINNKIHSFPETRLKITINE